MTRTLFTPLFSTLLRDRRFGFVVSSAGVIQLSLALFGAPGWPCPILHALGIPCPGCGMTRATLSLFHGDWQLALTTHAFAPVLLLALTAITFCALVPRRYSEWVAARSETIERQTGIAVLLLLGLMLYWLARLAVLQTAFVRLVQQ